MTKKDFQRQNSIHDAIDAADNYEDENYDTFREFLFDSLLINVVEVPFDDLMSAVSIDFPTKHKTIICHTLPWRYTVQRKLINGINVYSFRFPDFSDSTTYQEFHVERHPKFQPVKWRHRSADWYQYVGSNLLKEIDDYLKIKKVIESGENHQTKLFVNRKSRRIDIAIALPATSEKISIDFEPGYPEDKDLFF